MNIRETSVDFINTLFDMLDSYKNSHRFKFTEVRPLIYPYSLEMNELCYIRLKKVVDPSTRKTRILDECNMFGRFEFGKLLNTYINDIENIA